MRAEASFNRLMVFTELIIGIRISSCAIAVADGSLCRWHDIILHFALFGGPADRNGAMRSHRVFVRILIRSECRKCFINRPFVGRVHIHTYIVSS